MITPCSQLLQDPPPARWVRDSPQTHGPYSCLGWGMPCHCRVLSAGLGGAIAATTVCRTHQRPPVATKPHACMRVIYQSVLDILLADRRRGYYLPIRNAAEVVRILPSKACLPCFAGICPIIEEIDSGLHHTPLINTAAHPSFTYMLVLRGSQLRI